MKKILSTLKYLLDNFEGAAMCITFICMASVCFIQVICRYILKISMPWSEEFLRAMFVWSSCLGASLAFTTKDHMGVDAVTTLMPKKIKKIFSLFSYIVCIAFCMFSTYFSVKVSMYQFSTMQKTPAMKLPIFLVSIALPIGFVLSIVRIFRNIYNEFIRKQQDNSGDDEIQIPASM